MNVYPYRQGSRSAKALATALGGKVLKRENGTYRGRADKTVINWGSHSPMPPNVRGSKIINPPERTAHATNKTTFFDVMTRAGVRTPEWTTKPVKAVSWLRDGQTVMVRHTVTGQGGAGIEVIEPGKGRAADLDIPAAPLYTMYIPKKHEYRIHVMAGEVIFVQKKVARKDQPPKTWHVRSHDNGFVFQHNDLGPIPADVTAQAIKAWGASGLDFAAIDVIYSKEGKAYVLEANTAPGLEGETVQRYAAGFRRHY